MIEHEGGGIMGEKYRPRVISLSRFNDAHLIDGGDTLSAVYQTPEGEEIALLLPRREALVLQRQIAELLTQPMAPRTMPQSSVEELPRQLS